MTAASVLAIGVVAHTSRVTAAKQLAQQVRADFISIDNGCMGCDENHDVVRRHLSALPSQWSVILEDDAVPAGADFRAEVSAALLMAPSPIVSLYLGRMRPPHYQKRIGAALAEAKACGANWIVASDLLHAVGYCVRTDLLASLSAHRSSLPADQHVSSWCRSFGHVVSYAVPSLVDHADVPTVVAHRDRQPRPPGRTAWLVGVRDEWSTDSVPLR